jgi:hypothetical protein
MTGFGKWSETPYLPWKPAASLDAFGPDVLEPPEGVMVAAPVPGTSSENVAPLAAEYGILG